MNHKFGGDWTDDKLSRLQKYLSAYTTIFKTNRNASYYSISYLDAFAGTGFRESSDSDDHESLLLFGESDQDAKSLKKGSVSIALETTPTFDRYIFIDKNAKHINKLTKTVNERFPNARSKISINLADANQYIKQWCLETNWKNNRAVAFLDPYGMQVEWDTLEAIAKTKAVDLWILFPLGQGINRMLTKNGPPDKSWSGRLTKFFGTDKWIDAFYTPSKQEDMFGKQDLLEKDADFDAIKSFLVRRLKTIFAAVSPNPLALKNSKNVQIFLLCFAVGNPKKSDLALRIASNILRP